MRSRLETERASGRAVRSAALLLVLAGCATASQPTAGPERIAALEASMQGGAASAETRVELAAAYRQMGEPQRAVDLLEVLVRVRPDDRAAALYLGLAYEDLERLGDARATYQAFLATDPPSSLRGPVEARLEVVGRRELRAAARVALAREAELANVIPPPQTVGVFPFLFAGADEGLGPLGRALAELLTTDLAVPNRLRVLERAQVQYLLDEMQMAGEGYVQRSTAARAGHVLGAAHLIQGRIEGTSDALGLQALVVPTVSGVEAAPQPIDENGALEQVMDMEKSIALGVFDRLGIQLTVAERQAVNQRATDNIQALLAFGFGLEAQDAGRYDEAMGHFDRAARLDPGFTSAARARQRSERLQQGSAASTATVAGLAATEFQVGLTDFERLQARLSDIETVVPGSSLPRHPGPEGTGTVGFASPFRIDLIIRRPGGI